MERTIVLHVFPKHGHGGSPFVDLRVNRVRTAPEEIGLPGPTGTEPFVKVLAIVGEWRETFNLDQKAVAAILDHLGRFVSPAASPCTESIEIEISEDPLVHPRTSADDAAFSC